MLRIFASLLCVSVLAGCSSTSGSAAASKNDSSSWFSSTKISIEWRTRLGEGSGTRYIRLEPVVDAERVYAADVDGVVRALDLDYGYTEWSTDLGQPITAGLTLVGNRLLVGTRDGSLHSLNAENGEVQWSQRLSSEMISPASSDGRRIFVHTIDGRVTAVELNSGAQAWSYESALPVLTVRGTSTPLVLDALVVVGFATGKLVALDKALGIPRWEVRLASPDGRSELERLVDIDGSPTLDGNLIYAASYHGKVAAVGINGEVRWQEEGSSYTRPGLALGNLYLTLDNDHIQAYDQNNGAKVWQQSALEGRKLGQVTAHGRWLAVADNEGYVHVLSQVTGELLAERLLRPQPLYISYPNQTEATNWRALRGKHMGIRSALVSTEKGLLVYTNTGELLLVSIHDR